MSTAGKARISAEYEKRRCSQASFLSKWRMRRDLNPRYESPRIHDFESRAFSLSATHPQFVWLSIKDFLSILQAFF